MGERRNQIVYDVDGAAISNLFAEWGVTQPLTQLLVEKILQTATTCRVALVSVVNATANNPAWPVPPEAVISQTMYGLRRGRPKSAEWAFWTAFCFQQDYRFRGKTATSKQLAALISILLNRHVTPEVVRTEFVRLRCIANEQATKAARAILETVLRPKLSSRAFARIASSIAVDTSTATTRRQR